MIKLTRKTALGYVTRIEDLNIQISAVYREVCDAHGACEISLIRDLVAAREAASDSKAEADGLLASIDAEDET